MIYNVSETNDSKTETAYEKEMNDFGRVVHIKKEGKKNVDIIFEGGKYLVEHMVLYHNEIGNQIIDLKSICHYNIFEVDVYETGDIKVQIEQDIYFFCRGERQTFILYIDFIKDEGLIEQQCYSRILESQVYPFMQFKNIQYRNQETYEYYLELWELFLDNLKSERDDKDLRQPHLMKFYHSSPILDYISCMIVALQEKGKLHEFIL